MAALAQQAERWLCEMEFGFLYDHGRQLFRIGFNASSGQRDPNYYDLLASEARLTSFVAIATRSGAISQKPGPLAVTACTRVRSEEHTSELQSLMRISYAVFCLKKKKQQLQE